MITASKTRVLSTVKKDEAAFYLNELARGLLKDRVSIRVGDQTLVFDTFETIRLEMMASEKKRQYAVEIRLAWRKTAEAAPTDLPDRHPVAAVAVPHSA
jgi:amphi-Trp domain-containing protein